MYTQTHIFTGILLSPKKDNILPFVTTWMDLKGMLLSEVSQIAERQIPYYFT